MKLSISATLFITLSAHRYLSHALPVGSRPRDPSPRGVDYLVVDVIDPEASAPNLAPGDDQDDESDDITTRTGTGTSEADPTTTATRTPTPTSTPTDSITGGFVPVVGVKETGGAVRSIAMVRLSESTSRGFMSEPTPSPPSSSHLSPTIPTGSHNATLPAATSSSTTAVLSEEPSFPASSVSNSDIWPSSDAWPPWDEYNVAPTSATSSPTAEALPEESSFSASAVSISDVWPAWSPYDAAFPSVTPRPTTTVPSYMSPPPASVETSWPSQPKVADDNPELQPTTIQTTWSLISASIPSGVEGGPFSTVPTTTALLPTGDTGAPLYDESEHHEPDDGGYPLWNGTVTHRFRPSEHA